MITSYIKGKVCLPFISGEEIYDVISTCFLCYKIRIEHQILTTTKKRKGKKKKKRLIQIYIRDTDIYGGVRAA